MLSPIFKAYDVRGVYKKNLTDKIAYKIGRAFVTFLKTKEVLIGRDARASSPKLHTSLVQGIIDQGANVIDIGLASTPMFYFAAAKAKSAIMITASHNPKKFNGFKLESKGISISDKTGIKEIKALAKKNKFITKKQGNIKQKNVLNSFAKFSAKFLKTKKHYKIVVDAGNGMGGYTYPSIIKYTNLKLIPLYFKFQKVQTEKLIKIREFTLIGLIHL